ncbi:MAG: hypothetical protein QOG20_4211 [Pseudonocardiales bacterium]|jgi:hypothetical protein|nr:hypothetical protein [Pseudonocardiales bacterium]
MERARFDISFASIYLTDPGAQTTRRVGLFGTVDDSRIVPVQIDRRVRPSPGLLSAGGTAVDTPTRGPDGSCAGRARAGFDSAVARSPVDGQRTGIVGPQPAVNDERLRPAAAVAIIPVWRRRSVRW